MVGLSCGERILTSLAIFTQYYAWQTDERNCYIENYILKWMWGVIKLGTTNPLPPNNQHTTNYSTVSVMCWLLETKTQISETDHRCHWHRHPSQRTVDSDLLGILDHNETLEPTTQFTSASSPADSITNEHWQQYNIMYSFQTYYVLIKNIQQYAIICTQTFDLYYHLMYTDIYTWCILTPSTGEPH